MTHRSIKPNTNLVLSLRDMGYSLNTALADVIDNSISAGARHVHILSSPTSPPRITITDDGCGMTEEEIIRALTLADVSPATVRVSSDLGRFGMGMKTASWSQCRRLTLISRKAGRIAGATVDLDRIQESGEWFAEVWEKSDLLDLPQVAKMPGDGTIVMWEAIDRVVTGTGAQAERELAKKLNQASQHLELVFHRFLSPDAGQPKLDIIMNGRSLEARDPFCARHPSTQESPTEIIPLADQGDVRIQVFTLPHHDRLPKDESDDLGGPEGYLANQGCYLYRERRLILWGTWFRLTKRHPTLNLCRVRIDIPNSMDHDWQINIIKASAAPPSLVRERLQQLIRSGAIGVRSQRAYTQRGSRQATESCYPIWAERRAGGQLSYEIVDDHPMIVALNRAIAPAQRKQLRSLLKLVAGALPLDAMMVSLSNSPDSVRPPTIDEDSLHVVLDTIWDAQESQSDAIHALERLLGQEPFRSNTDAVRRYVETRSADA